MSVGISAFCLYFARFSGVPVVGLAVVFVGMQGTEDPGGPLFILLLVLGSGCFLTVALTVDVLLLAGLVAWWLCVCRKRNG